MTPVRDLFHTQVKKTKTQDYQARQQCPFEQEDNVGDGKPCEMHCNKTPPDTSAYTRTMISDLLEKKRMQIW
jgi:hypothetical protein